MPLAKLDLLVGYALAFAVFAAVQATVVSTYAIVVLDLGLARPAWAVVALAIANAILGMSLGLFLSAFARSEFQAVQFMPAFIFPQLFLCGLFAERADMARVLELASYAMPMTYAFDALDRVARGGALGSAFAVDLVVIAVSILAALALGAATLRRRTA
jgi:ABC-2 type transport system permease protein